MNKPRLLEVVRVLRKVPDRKFDMGIWSNECGTVGCAIGHYCFAHPRAALKVNKGGPRLGRRLGINALAAYFGITLREAFDLFIPAGIQGCFTRRKVIDRITRFVEGGSK